MLVNNNQLDEQRFPRLPGTYALVCRLETCMDSCVGRLGTFPFETGCYIYIGSALGPGGLAGRLERYLSQGRHNRHWHIDYLIEAAPIKEVWYWQSEVRHEHEWATMLSRAENVQIPVPRFGASDCRCQSHLFYFENPVGPALFEQPLIVVDLSKLNTN